MELRQLKYYVKVAECLNFSEAARSLYVTQSTLSQQIRQLENELGTELFQRNSHSVRLTEAGECLLPYALSTLRNAETCMDQIQNLQQLKTGILNIGSTYSFGSILLEATLIFVRKYPQIKLNIFYKPMEDLMEMLLHGDLDFVLAFKPLQRYEEVESHVLFDNHLSVIVRSNHILADRESVSLQDLQQFDLALPAKGLQARSVLEKLWARYDVQLKVKVDVNDVNALLRLVRQSEMVTILAEATLYNEQGVRAIPLDVEENKMEGCVHILKNIYRKCALPEFIRILSETNAVLLRRQDWLK